MITNTTAMMIIMVMFTATVLMMGLIILMMIDEDDEGGDDDDGDDGKLMTKLLKHFLRSHPCSFWYRHRIFQPGGVKTSQCLWTLHQPLLTSSLLDLETRFISAPTQHRRPLSRLFINERYVCMHVRKTQL